MARKWPDKRRCRTCVRVLPNARFDGPFARRCDDCWSAIREAQCVRCGDPAGVATGGEPRRYCEPCRVANLSDMRRAAGRKPIPSHRECLICARRMLLNEENFSVNERDSDGSPLVFHSYCRPCKAAELRDKYRTNQEFRTKALTRNAIRRAQERRRRRRDPDFDERCRAYAREASRRAREKQRNGDTAPRLVADGGGGMLPLAPLAAVLRKELARAEAEGADAPVQVVAALCGTSDRTVRRWLNDDDATAVQFDAADRALIGLDLLWWEVWEPDEYPAAAALWDAELVAA